MKDLYWLQKPATEMLVTKKNWHVINYLHTDTHSYGREHAHTHIHTHTLTLSSWQYNSITADKCLDWQHGQVYRQLHLQQLLQQSLSLKFVPFLSGRFSSKTSGGLWTFKVGLLTWTYAHRKRSMSEQQCFGVISLCFRFESRHEAGPACVFPGAKAFPTPSLPPSLPAIPRVPVPDFPVHWFTRVVAQPVLGGETRSQQGRVLFYSSNERNMSEKLFILLQKMEWRR